MWGFLAARSGAQCHTDVEDHTCGTTLCANPTLKQAIAPACMHGSLSSTNVVQSTDTRDISGH